jgi:hypothetical protein
MILLYLLGECDLILRGAEIPYKIQLKLDQKRKNQLKAVHRVPKLAWAGFDRKNQPGMV